MTRMNEKFLNNLLNSISVSGYEEQVQDIVTEEMKEYTDEIRRDEMQNLTCILNPENDVRIMLSAHADEIGLMISNIREDGRLQVIDRGGIVPATYPGRQVRIKTKNGEIYGVVEAYRDLFKEENLGTKHFLIDIGAKDRKAALKNLILGNPIVPDTHIRKMKNGKFTARALDDRLGVYIIMEAIKRAKELGCKVGAVVTTLIHGSDGFRIVDICQIISLDTGTAAAVQRLAVRINLRVLHVAKDKKLLVTQVKFGCLKILIQRNAGNSLHLIRPDIYNGNFL